MKLRTKLAGLGFAALALTGAFVAPAAAQAAPAPSSDTVSAQAMVFYDDFWNRDDCIDAGNNLVRIGHAKFFVCEESWIDWDLYIQP
jgi:hypothetical protein